MWLSLQSDIGQSYLDQFREYVTKETYQQILESYETYAISTPLDLYEALNEIKNNHDLYDVNISTCLLMELHRRLFIDYPFKHTDLYSDDNFRQIMINAMEYLREQLIITSIDEEQELYDFLYNSNCVISIFDDDQKQYIIQQIITYLILIKLNPYADSDISQHIIKHCQQKTLNGHQWLIDTLNLIVCEDYKKLDYELLLTDLYKQYQLSDFCQQLTNSKHFSQYLSNMYSYLEQQLMLIPCMDTDHLRECKIDNLFTDLRDKDEIEQLLFLSHYVREPSLTILKNVR